MLDVLHQGYVQTARAKGLAEQIVLRRHAFKNAAIPLITVIALDLANWSPERSTSRSSFPGPAWGSSSTARRRGATIRS